MKSRHRAREVALQFLYRHDVAAQSATIKVLPKKPHELAAEVSQHFDHFQVPPAIREFAAQLVTGTLAEMSHLDSILERHAANWKIGRMSLVDRNLLRMASYELLHFPENPPSVVIDEAIELGKQFGTADSAAFINGILDSIKTESIKPSDKPSD